MAPREANNPYPDQYLTIEYDATAMMMPHDAGPAVGNDTETMGEGTEGMDDLPLVPDTTAAQNDIDDNDDDEDDDDANVDNDNNGQGQGQNPATTGVDEASLDDDEDDEDDDDDEDEDEQSVDEDNTLIAPQPPVEVHLPTTTPLPTNLSGDVSPINRHQPRGTWSAVQRNHRPGFGVLNHNQSNNDHNHNSHSHGHNHSHHHRRHHQNQNRVLLSVGSDPNQPDIDPLAIDMTGPEEEETWDRTHSMFVEAAMALAGGGDQDSTSTSHSQHHWNSPRRSSRSSGNMQMNVNVNSNSNMPVFSRASRQISSDSISLDSSQALPPRVNPSAAESAFRGTLVSPTPNDSHAQGNGNGNVSNMSASVSSSLSPRSNAHRRRTFHRGSLSSVLDQDPSISEDEQEDDNDLNGMPDLDTTATSDTSSAPNTPPSSNTWNSATSAPHNATTNTTAANQPGRFTLSPVRRLMRRERSLFQNSTPAPSTSNSTLASTSNSTLASTSASTTTPPPAAVDHVNIVTDEETTTAPVSPDLGATITPSSLSAANSTSSPNIHTNAISQGLIDGINLPPSPRRLISGSSIISGPMSRRNSTISNHSGRSIRLTTAFEASLNFDGNASDTSSNFNNSSTSSIGNTSINAVQGNNSSHNHINFSFGSSTNVADLKYFAERGCIVHLLRALDTPRLKTLGTRMLADYAKMPHRRVAVASNKRILEFCCRTMLEMPSDHNMGTEWPAREYAVETIRSLTATEDSDSFLMGCTGLLKALAIVVRGGPFYDISNVCSSNNRGGVGGDGFDSLSRPALYHCDTTVNMGLVSGKARLHACIAIMNLSCGKSNKIEIASVPEVLEAMRDVMVAVPEHFSPATSSPHVPNSSSSTATPKSVSDEARLKAATCIKNLSNADANDASLLGSDGLVKALAHAAVVTCREEKGATHCTTNACLALMNLSISKANKHTVFTTEGVMDALMTVLARTKPCDNGIRNNSNNEARVKACSALSNLAIGYENKIPMFAYEGFVDAILQVIKTDTGEARTKACSILWSFAAEMKNQVPVVQRGDILPTLVRVAEEDHSTEARFKCVAALTLLAESLENALPLLESGALHPLMDILHEAGADPTQWKGQTASWCVGFLMNMAQSDDAAPFLREAGVVELLAPLLTLDHYQSLKAAMAVTFICRFDEDDETYDLLRKTENVIPKIISLLHNTLSGRGGNGYKYGVFTLRSSVGCISSLASGPEFMKERIATKPVFDSLLRVTSDYCVNGGTKGAIVGGGRDDALSATLAVRALHSLTEYMIPIPGSSALPFGPIMDKKLMVALESFSVCTHPEVKDETRDLARDGFHRIQKSLGVDQCAENDNDSGSEGFIPRRTVANNIIENSIVASLVQGCCIGPSLHAGDVGGFFPSMIRRSSSQPVPAPEVSDISDGNDSTDCGSTGSQEAVRTFLLTDSRTGRLFAVPTDPSGGRSFNDGRQWCYRRGRYCRSGEVPDPNFVWTEEMQQTYSVALHSHRSSSPSSSNDSNGSRGVQPQSIAPVL